MPYSTRQDEWIMTRKPRVKDRVIMMPDERMYITMPSKKAYKVIKWDNKQRSGEWNKISKGINEPCIWKNNNHESYRPAL